MDTLDKETLVSLAEIGGGKCVSLYMPVHRGSPGPDTQQDPIQFKNLLRRAEALLIGQGLRVPEAAELMAPASRIQHQTFFREHPADGMAMFIAPGLFRCFLLPVVFDAQVFVDRRLILKPLIKLFASEGTFHLLCLSQDDIRFFRGTRFRLDALPLKNVPPTRKDAQRYEEHQQIVRVLPSSRGGSMPTFYGHGAGLEDAKNDICRFFRLVNKGVQDHLGASTAPLLLAGVEYVVQLYREVSDYPHILAEHITGSASGLPDEELHSRAWSMVEPYFNKNMRSARSLYAQISGNAPKQVSESIESIVPAARDGRVRTLFLARGEEQWGAFSAGSDTVVVHRDRRPTDEDLLNLAAIHTIGHSGAVHLLERNEMPGHAPAAAIFRY